MLNLVRVALQLHPAGAICATQLNPRDERFVSSAAACFAVHSPRLKLCGLFPVRAHHCLRTCALGSATTSTFFPNGNCSTATTFVSREESNGAAGEVPWSPCLPIPVLLVASSFHLVGFSTGDLQGAAFNCSY